LPTHGMPIEPGAETNHGTVPAGEKPQLKLGRYEVVRELGKGAMGVVYLAKDPLIGRLVALKTIRVGQYAEDDEATEFQQRFIREAQAAGILNHPSIVTVHDIGQDEPTGVSFIAMEYVEGQNLKEVLAQGRALSFEQIGDVVAQVAEGLDFAHAKGIVHRDVKPANIILLEGMRAKITDFGIAKIASGAANLTTTGQFLGTPNYMAPEQIKGAPVDGRTDIFALGICLYECLTRRKPFGGDSLTSISYKIVHEPFPPLHEINPQIPEPFEEVVAHCLAKDPSKRYQRARDLANALRAIGRGEKPVRPPDPLLADETVVTRDLHKIPTIEVPFPEADEIPAPPAVTEPHDVGGSTRPAAKAVASAAAAKAAPKPPREPFARKVSRTLDGVRALPAWRRRISPGLFLGIVAVMVVMLLGVVVAARTQDTNIQGVDPQIVAQRAKERKLREDGNKLMSEGRFAEAQVKFTELQRMAPKSAYVTPPLHRLQAMRQQEEVGKQQQAQARLKFDEGKALFDQKKYAAAIPLLQESLTINPAAPEAAQLLQQAQLEEQKLQAAKVAARTRTTPSSRNAAGNSTATTGTPASEPQTQVTATAAAEPAQLTTFFNHPFTDGTITVKAGAEVVLHAQLSEESGRGIFRRRKARLINLTNPLTPKNADLQIWVTVPSQQINQYHVMPHSRFEPGRQHRLTVGYNKQAKTFSYELN
jgi:serine/threonine protein kinase